MLQFTRIEPAPGLDLLVQGYWFLEAGAARQSLALIPDGFPELVVPLMKSFTLKNSAGKIKHIRKPALIGQLLGRPALCFEPFARCFFVKLYPWAPAYLFQASAEGFTDKAIDLDTLCANPVLLNWAETVVETSTFQQAAKASDVYLKRLLPGVRVNAFLQQAVERIYRWHGVLDTESLRQGVQASRRYIEKLFKAGIGLAPKQYARLIRLKKASLLLQENSAQGHIGRVAETLGYFDSSHFLKDFKAETGLSPTEFLKMQPEFSSDSLNDYLRQWDYS